MLSYDERTDTSLYQPVMDVIQGEKQYQLIKLTLESGESIETTAEHPFYIQGKGWNAANTLKVGDALQLYNGTVVVVKTVDTSVRVERVYNLTVANTHNYFVGSDGVLVHNCKNPRTPIGRKGQNLEGFDPKNPQNLPGKIGNIEYSGHAFDNMQSQGIMPSAVENAIKNGKSMPGKTSGTTAYHDVENNLTVITDTASGRVITTDRGLIRQ